MQAMCSIKKPNCIVFKWFIWNNSWELIAVSLEKCFLIKLKRTNIKITFHNSTGSSNWEATLNPRLKKSYPNGQPQ